MYCGEGGVVVVVVVVVELERGQEPKEPSPP